LIPPRSCLNSTRAPLSTPFPYTTLFRSLPSLADQDQVLRLGTRIAPSEPPSRLPRRRERLVVAAPEPIKPTLANLALTSRTEAQDRKSTRLNSSHEWSSYAVFCLQKTKQ